MHNGFVNIDKEKMSKSLNNFITLRESFKSYPGRVIRFLYLLTHYRSPLDFSADLLEQAKGGLARIDQFLGLLGHYKPGDAEIEVAGRLEEEEKAFQIFIDNDFDVSGALGVVFRVVTDMNDAMQKKLLSGRDVQLVRDWMGRVDSVLGVAPDDDREVDPEIDALIQEREAARKARDFARSDEIRDMLKARGIVLEDTPDGVMWKRV